MTSDLASAALVTIDVQRDVLDSGPFGIAGTTAALPAISRLASAFRQASRPVVHVVRLYLADGSNAEPCRRDLVRTAPGPLLRPGTAGAELAEGLLPPATGGPGGAARSGSDGRLDVDLLLAGRVQRVVAGSDLEVIVYKPRWGAFFRTPVDEHLRRLGVDTLVFCGANFPNCPRTSVYQASERDYRVLLAADATSGLYQRGVDELAGIGVKTVTTDVLLTDLARLRRVENRA